MKKFLAVSILIFAFCAIVFAQNNQKLSCPTIDVFGPASVPQAGEVISFSANVEGIDLASLTYIWNVKGGEIIKGQGTSVIEIKLPAFWTGELSVEVEIEKFPEGCPNNEIVSLAICFAEPILIDTFSAQPTRIDKARLDNLITELQNNPTAQAYIVEYFAKNTPQKFISQKLQKIRDYLINVKGQDENRFTITTVLLNENLTNFWIIPAGATFPEP